MSPVAGGHGPALAAFGDLEQNLWGVVVGGAQPRVAVGTFSPDGAADLIDAALAPAPDGAGWSLSADRLAVTITPAAGGPAPVDGDPVPPDDNQVLELCHAAGIVEHPNGPREVSLGAVRNSALPVGKLDSIRFVAAWFGDEHAIAVQAVRPQGAKGHDRDELFVATFGEREGLSVFDPRLSTTYGRDGAPRRMGLELWLGETEEGDQFPRRLAGEATGAAVGDTAASLRWEARPLRCHSRGCEGAGIYLLFRP